MFAFLFGSTNPQRVAERQLNRAKLDLLEVSGALETYEAQKAALETRITRLKAGIAAERGEAPVAPAKPVKERNVRAVGNGMLQDA